MTTPNTATVIPFNDICEPGTYVCNWSGHLMQIPANCIEGGTTCVNLWGNDTPSVTKISDDCTISVDEARTIAQNCDCTVKF